MIAHHRGDLADSGSDRDADRLGLDEEPGHRLRGRPEALGEDRRQHPPAVAERIQVGGAEPARGLEARVLGYRQALARRAQEQLRLDLEADRVELETQDTLA